MDLAKQLLEEARRDNQRRLIVLSGSPANTREKAGTLLETIDIPTSEITAVGPSPSFPCENLGYDDASELMGTTREVVILDCHERCEPNNIGQLVGAVDGGGILVLLTPPLSSWDSMRDSFDETLAVPPFDVSSVTGLFRKRLVETLRQHRGIALIDADSDCIEQGGRIEYPPSDVDSVTNSTSELTIPDETAFPRRAYEQCLTRDQIEAVGTLETLRESGNAVVVEANRGRGKSTAGGLAAGSLALSGLDIVVTGPQYRNVRTLFESATRLLEAMGEHRIDSETNPQELQTSSGRIRYLPPVEASDQAAEADCVIVDEAASLPVRLLSETLDAPRVAYITTTHGYEGAGRGFSVRFRDHLDSATHTVTEQRLHTPIRYAAGDPIETWSFRALALDATPPVDAVVSEVSPDSVTHRQLSGEELLADEPLLKEVFGLLVLAHYRTEPNDLQRLFDAPNVSVHALFHDGHPVSVALLAREGGFSPEQRAEIYEGKRIRGNLIPDVLTSQLRDESSGATTGYRIMRIATHGAVRSRGLGSRLLSEIEDSVSDADWLGVGYGATPELVEFWRANGYAPVHLSTTRNQRSGEHSVVMLRPRSRAGEQLLSRHTEWLLARLPWMFPDALRDVEPDVIRAVCRSIPATPKLELSDWEWRHAASVAAGPGIFEMAPGAVRQLAFHAIVDQTGPPLSPREERLLVRRVLQLHPAELVATELDFQSEAVCMRRLGEVVRRLLDAYGPASLDDELNRLE